MTEDEENQLREALMRADLELKQRQSFWETPKAIAIIVATTAALMGTVAGLAGYRFGQAQAPIIQLPSNITVHVDPSGPVSK